MFLQLSFWFLSIFGFGKILRKDKSVEYQLISGLAFLFLVATVIPIFFKVNIFVTSIVGITGFMFFIYSSISDRGYSYKPIFIILILISIFISGISLRGIHTYDAGLYHIPHMKFLIEEGIVRGMANISHRYGFNSLLIPFTSLLAWDKSSLFDYRIGANVILLIVMVVMLLNIMKMKLNSVLGIFSVTFLGGILLYYKKIILSPGTDITSGILILFFFWLILKNISSRKPFLEEDINILGLISALVICFKITNSLVFIPLASLIFFETRKQKILLKSVLTGQSFIISCALGAFWLIQNVLISGCITYPIALTCFSPSTLPWSLGPGAARSMVSVIKGWNRRPGPDWNSAIQGWGWVEDWIQRSQNQLLIVLFLVFIIWTIFHFIKKSEGLRMFSLLLSSFLVPTMIVWFLGAPDPRFLDPYVKILVFGCLLMSLHRIKFLEKIKTNYFLRLVTIASLAAFFTSAKYIKKETVWGLVAIPNPRLELLDDKITRIPEKNSDQCWASHKFCQPQKWKVQYKKENGELEYIFH